MIFEKIRYTLARFVLRRKASRLKRQKMLFDFSSAHYVGVLCATEDETTTRQLKDFLQYLTRKGVKYLVIGYFDGKKIPENFLFWKGMDFITRKDLNFFYIPRNPTVDRFITEPFDMLINCSIAEYFPLEYIAQLSPAKCKAGVLHEGDSCYDLMMDIRKNRTVGYFLENLRIYFSDLKHPEQKPDDSSNETLKD